jgi:hypothetical protein
MMATLIKKDIKLTTRAPWVNFVVLFLVGVSVFTAMPLLSKTGIEEYFISTPLFIFLLCYYIFIDDLFRKEESMKTMEYNLLAGVNLPAIWFSKAVAPFLLSYGAMTVFALLFILFTKNFPSHGGALMGFIALPLFALPFFFLFSIMCLFKFYTITSFLCIIPVIISQFLRINPLFYAFSYIIPVAGFFILRKVSVEKVVKT